MSNKPIKVITEDDSFNLGGFIEEVKSSSKNSRTAIISLVLVTFFVLMTLVNTSSPEFNWYKDRRNLAFRVYNDIVFNKKDKKESFIEVTRELENKFSKNENDRQEFLNYIKETKADFGNTLLYKKNNFRTKSILNINAKTSFKLRKEKYNQYITAIDYCSDRGITSKQDIKDIITFIIENKSENIDLVKVPILGITFDINYLGIYAGLIMLLMIWLLYAAMNREHMNTKITFKRAWSESHFNHFIFYEFMSMTQVLHEPKKLFEHKKFSSKWFHKFIHNAINHKGIRLLLYFVIALFIIGLLIYFYFSNWPELEKNFYHPHYGSLLVYAFSIANVFICAVIMLIIPFLKKGENKKSLNYKMKEYKAEITPKHKVHQFLHKINYMINLRATKIIINSNSEIFFNNRLSLTYLEVMRLISISIPLIVYFLVYANDVASVMKGEFLNCRLTFFTISAESVFCSLILFYIVKVNTIKIQITDLWTNRAITFNFKYILGAVDSMEKNFKLDNYSKIMIAIFKFNKRFPKINPKELFQIEEVYANIKSTDRQFIEKNYKTLSESKLFDTHKNLLKIKNEIINITDNKALFYQLKYILLARILINQKIKNKSEYKSMGMYADDNKPLEIFKGKSKKKKRVQFIKEMCLISILEIIKNKKMYNNAVDKEWSYQDKKMATIELRNHINKILSLNKSDINNDRLRTLLAEYNIINISGEQKPKLVDYFWDKLVKSYESSSKNGIANNSFYKLFDQIEIDLHHFDLSQLK